MDESPARSVRILTDDCEALSPFRGCPEREGGESFFPVQVNAGGIRPPAVSVGEVRSMVFIFVVAVDAAGDGLEVFLTFSVHPATNTVANTLVTIKMINNCFFIVIPSFGENFPLRCSQTASKCPLPT